MEITWLCKLSLSENFSLSFKNTEIQNLKLIELAKDIFSFNSMIVESDKILYFLILIDVILCSNIKQQLLKLEK